VDVLLDDMVAAEPDEVVPVVELVGHIGHVGLARVEPDAAAVPVDTQGCYVADGAVVNLLDRLLVAELVAALRAGDDE